MPELLPVTDRCLPLNDRFRCTAAKVEQRMKNTFWMTGLDKHPWFNVGYGAISSVAGHDRVRKYIQSGPVTAIAAIQPPQP